MGEPRFLCIADPQPHPDAVLGWRLIGGNNRELGRSPVPFRNAAICLLTIDRLRAGCSRLVPVVQAGVDGRGWRWATLLDGSALAISGRAYPRARECRYAVQRFLAAVPRATRISEVTVRHWPAAQASAAAAGRDLGSVI